MERKESLNRVSWNDNIEEAAKTIGETARAYKLMHITEAQKSNKDYTRLMYLGIILGPTSGIISGIGAALNPEMNPTFPIIEIMLGFLSGIVVASIKFGRYDEVSNANKIAAARYSSIESNVRRQLSLNREDRQPSVNYMEWLETKYEELLLSAPLLPPSNYDKYIKEAKEQNWIIPEKYDHVININQGSRREQILRNNEISVNIVPNPNIQKGIEQIRRSVTGCNISATNQYSDQMLNYELGRMENR